MRALPMLVVLALLGCNPLSAWGRKGHQILAHLALKDLPPDPAAWFKGLEDIVADHSSDPDEWKNDREEGPRHFLDMDLYGNDVPFHLEEARAKVGAKVFQRAGQLPWVIQDRVAILAKAFQAGHRQEVALQTAFLSHYVGDLHVPLHTVENYDGNLTGQHGVHSRWETGLVDRMAGTPDVRPATLEPEQLKELWRWLKASNGLVPALLADDKASSQGGQGPSGSYWLMFNQRQGPSVKEQLAEAGQHTAQLIILAWSMAGQPAVPKA